ncbi:chemotaxis protein CheD [Aliibacillus thermotolerans]|uniref:Probable chemoreceptor glutamine deamidase CheD n=1 Tax=Aliibacillus thermotolerans TaxID=1834418 RepID=A0ABW0U750_9BACI|nr:chemotaxis protein CheD [Aliibacillus thermotolerans]MDA3130592.1 chemotaxis protein CheD [Aliibacillus thermotolerans]
MTRLPLHDANHIVKVGMADWKIAVAPDLIRTSGLGSCVGVVLYDSMKKIAALAHIMLPDSSLARNKAMNRAKFADTALEDVIVALQKKGSDKRRLQAKMAGGAQMFSFSSGNDLMRIGPRNREAIVKILSSYHIPILAEDTGGNKGRTITFHTETGELHIRTIHEGETII